VVALTKDLGSKIVRVKGLTGMKNILNRSDLRIAVLDLEASALGVGSYPIEVGVALIQDAGHPVRTWSTMIRPTEAWLNDGLWSPASACIHGISLDTLEEQGHAVEDVCDWLDVLLGSGTIVATDAPRYDQDWLDTLFKAARREQLFTLYDFDLLTGGLGPDQYRHLVYLLDRDQVPHRAGADALRLASKLMEAHRGYPPRSEPLEHPPHFPPV
jgi:DNA polymerase III epsilon subunit-like protein